MDEKSEQYYNYLKSQEGVQVPPSYEVFKEVLSDDDKREKYYNYLSSKKDVIKVPPSYEVFSKAFAQKPSSKEGKPENFTKGSSELSGEPTTEQSKVGTPNSPFIEQKAPIGIAAPEKRADNLYTVKTTSTGDAPNSPFIEQKAPINIAAPEKTPYDIRKTSVKLEGQKDPSTVLMSDYGDHKVNGKYVAFPTLFPKDPNNQTSNEADWIRAENDDQAYEIAKERGEVFEFDTREEASKFSNGGWKKKEPLTPYVEDFKQKPRAGVSTTEEMNSTDVAKARDRMASYGALTKVQAEIKAKEAELQEVSREENRGTSSINRPDNTKSNAIKLEIAELTGDAIRKADNVLTPDILKGYTTEYIDGDGVVKDKYLDKNIKGLTVPNLVAIREDADKKISDPLIKEKYISQMVGAVEYATYVPKEKLEEDVNRRFKDKYGKGIEEYVSADQQAKLSEVNGKYKGIFDQLTASYTAEAQKMSKIKSDEVSQSTAKQLEAYNSAMAQIKAQAQVADETQLVVLQAKVDKVTDEYNTAIANAYESVASYNKKINTDFNNALRDQTARYNEAYQLDLHGVMDGYEVPKEVMSDINQIYAESSATLFEKEKQRRSDYIDRPTILSALGNPIYDYATRGVTNTLSALGSSMGSIAVSMGGTGEYGDRMAQYFQPDLDPMESFKDLSIEEFVESGGTLIGGMAPSMLATLATAAVTKNLNMTTRVALTTLASWTTESTQLAGDAYKRNLQKTGSEEVAKNAASETWESQVALLPTYTLDVLPAVSAFKYIKNAPLRVVTGAVVDAAAETIQEYPQNLMEEAIDEQGDWTKFTEYHDTSKLESTFVNVLPMLLTGAAGNLKGETKLNPKNGLELIPDMVFKRGVTATKMALLNAYNGGQVGLTEYHDLLAQVEATTDVESKGLEYAKLNVKKNFLETAAERTKDPVEAKVLKQEAAAAEGQMIEMLRNPEKRTPLEMYEAAQTKGTKEAAPKEEVTESVQEPENKTTTELYGDNQTATPKLEELDEAEAVLDSVDDLDVKVITVNSLEDVPKAFKDRAEKVEGKDIEVRKTVLGIPYGKSTTAKTGEVWRYTATGKELKDHLQSTRDSIKDTKIKRDNTEEVAYFEELRGVKSQHPNQYWSVSEVPEGTEGAVVRVDGGAAFVKPDGDITGVFKNPDSKKKGVADNILKQAVKQGGKMLDNFDNYLTKVYQRNGFRIVSRTPFNEEFAPEGWNEAEHGKPDVVAMVYDPNKELNFEEKSFDTYDEAISYRNEVKKTQNGQTKKPQEEAPIVTDDAGKAITVYRGGKPASGVQYYTSDEKLAKGIGEAKGEGVQKATVRMANPWTPESLNVNNAPQWMQDWVRSQEEFTTVDEETMAAEEIPMEQAIQEIKDMRLSFRDVGLWQSFVNETLKHHDGIIAFDPSEDMATDKKIYITRSPEQIVTEDITKGKKEITNAEKTKIAEGIGKVRKVKPKNIKGLLDVMGGIFGLSKPQAESAAVVGDVIIGNAAKRAGISKDEMYQKIAYQKANLEDIEKLSEKGKVLYQIVGENANLTQVIKDNLATARQMEATEDPKTIKIATGWERGADGKWRYETVDNIPFLKDTVRSINKFIVEEGLDNGTGILGGDGELILPPELLELYPQLKDVEIFFDRKMSEYEGSYYPNKNKIVVGLGVRQENTVRVLLHEIQHAIQEIEGFAKGGSPKTMATRNDVLRSLLDNIPEFSREDRRKIKDAYEKAGLKRLPVLPTITDVESDNPSVLEDWIEKLEVLADVFPKNNTYRKIQEFLDFRLMEMGGVNVSLQKYLNLAGEVEARNVEKRMNMTSEQRRASILEETEDVARDEQVVLFEADGSLKRESPLFKSTAKEGLSKIQQKAATPEQWVKMITDKGGKGTSQELEWIGLQDYLNEWKKENNVKSVPKEVVEQYINDNQIEIQEITKGDKKDSKGRNEIRSQVAWILIGKGKPVYDSNGNEVTKNNFHEADSYFSDIDKGKVEGNPKYSDYTLDGGENYREVLLTLPSKKLPKSITDERNRLNYEIGELQRRRNNENISKEEKRNIDNDINKLQKEEVVLNEKVTNSKKSNYKSSHWDESNILAHLRLNERTLSNGERVLFIEEVQSDWAQEGKKKGFKEPFKAEKIESDVFDSWVVRGQQRGQFQKEIRIDYFTDSKKYESKVGAFDTLKEAVDAANNDLMKESSAVPQMPYKKTDQWVGMAMRRAMQMAAQEGFDRIAWTTGEQQFNRYGSSKVAWEKQSDGSWNVDFKEQVGGQDDFTAIEDQIIKGDTNLKTKEEFRDVIENLLSRERGQYSSENFEKYVDSTTNKLWGRMQSESKGQSLPRKEGMEGFYDSILRKVAEKEAKRFDKNSKVEDVDFGDNTRRVVVDVQRDGSIRLINEGGGFIAEYNKNQFDEAYKEADRLNERIDNSQVVGKQLSIPITPEMRMNLNSAVPLFQGEQGAMLAEDGKYIIYALINPNVSTPLHELAHVYEHYLTDAERKHIENWSGHKSGTVEFSEAFARGFEKFLADGKAPNAKLQAIFDSFKEWLTDIYNGIKGSDIDLVLNKEMKAIYGAMLSEQDTKSEKKAAANKSIDEAAQWLKDALKVDLGDADITMSSVGGITQDKLIDLAASAVKALVGKGIDVQEAIKKVVTLLKDSEYWQDGFNEDRISKGVDAVVKDEVKGGSSKSRVDAEIDGIIKGVRDGVSPKANPKEVNKRAFQGAVEYLQGSKWYENATDTQRERAYIELLKKTEQPIRRSPTTKRILGVPKPKMITLSETKLRDEFYKALDLGGKGAVREQRAMAEDVVEFLKNLDMRGNLSTPQVKAIAKRAARLNFKSPKAILNFKKYATRVAENATYADKLSEAKGIMSKLRTTKDLFSSDLSRIKDFKKLDPSKVKDIDKYIEIGNHIKNATKPNRAYTKDIKLQGVMDYAMVDEYIKGTIKEQEKTNQAEQKEMYPYLKDLGYTAEELGDIADVLESDRASLGEDVATKLEEDSRESAKKREEAVNRGLITLKTFLEPELTSKLENDENLSENEKTIIQKLIDADISKLSFKEKARTVNLIENILNNNSFSRATSIVNTLDVIRAKEDIIAKKIKGVSPRILFSKALAKTYLIDVGGLTERMKNIFRGQSTSDFVSLVSGIAEIDTGVVQARRRETVLIDKYNKMVSKMAGFNKASNIATRSVYAFATRNDGKTALEISKEFNRRKDIILDMESHLKNTDPVRYELFKGVLDGMGIREAKEAKDLNISDQNNTIVDFFVKEFGDVYAEHADIADKVFNKKLAEDAKYTPDIFTLIDGVFKDVDMNESSYFSDSMSTKESSMLMDVQKPLKLPKGRELSLDFDSQMIRKLSDAYLEINTAAPIDKLSKFATNDILNGFMDTDSKKVFIESVRDYVASEKGNLKPVNENHKVANKIIDIVSNFVSIKLLGSIVQPLKQVPMVAVRAAINTGSRSSSKLMFDVFTGRVSTELADNYGTVALRGKQSSVSIDNLNSRIKGSGALSKKIANAIGEDASLKTSAVLDATATVMEAPIVYLLEKPDVRIAKATWTAYYYQKMKQLNKGYYEFSMEEAMKKPNLEAIQYANSMVAQTQNESQVSKMGSVFKDRSLTGKIIRNVIFPFANFLQSLRTNIYNNVIIATSKSASSEDRLSAVKNIGTASVEIIGFNIISSALRQLTESALVSIFNLEPDDDEEEFDILFGIPMNKKERRIFLTNVLGDLSPAPVASQGILALVEKVNKELAGPKYTHKDDAIVYAPVDLSDWFTNDGGKFGTGLDIVLDTKDMLDMGDVFKEDGTYTKRGFYGDKEEDINPAYEADINRMMALQAFYLLTPSPSEIGKAAKRIKKDIEKDTRPWKGKMGGAKINIIKPNSSNINIIKPNVK